MESHYCLRSNIDNMSVEPVLEDYYMFVSGVPGKEGF